MGAGLSGLLNLYLFMRDPDKSLLPMVEAYGLCGYPHRDSSCA